MDTLNLPFIHLNMLVKAPSRTLVDYSRCGRIIASISNKEKNTVAIVVQVESDKKEFTETDEALIKTLCSVIELKVEIEKLIHKGRLNERQYSHLVNTMIKLMEAESQLQLAQSIREQLPIFHNFEVVEPLFYNQNKDELYTLYENTLVIGNDNALSFPVRVGISSEVVRKSEIIVSDPLSRQLFNGEIDNISSKREIRSFLFAPIFNDKGEINGVLQLLNKNGEIDKEDINGLKELATVYGLLVERVREKEKVMEILLEFRLLTKTSSALLLKDNYINEGSQIGDLVDVMKNLKALMSKIKRHKSAL